jgi:hypothetical protein
MATLPATVSRSLPAVASRAIGYAEPRHGTRSHGIGACREDGEEQSAPQRPAGQGLRSVAARPEPSM